LITDINSRIPVLVESTGARAIMAGDNTDQPRLIHMPPGSVANVGDRIVTSGHGGAFPPGLPIGVVSAVGEGDDGVVVQPFVGRDQLEYVQVIDYGLEGILQPPREVPSYLSRDAATNPGGEAASGHP
jgi:rod shape-determining protein MreC